MADKVNPYADHTPQTGSGLFFGLKDGETGRIRIQSDPYIFRSVFKRPDGTEQVSNRYGWLIYSHTAEMAQVMKMSATFFSQIAALAGDEDYGDPKGYDLKITRTGEGTDTKYQIVPAPKSLDIPENGKLQLQDMGPEDFKEDHIMLLADFVKAGSKWPETTSPSGDTIIKDVPENPLG